MKTHSCFKLSLLVIILLLIFQNLNSQVLISSGTGSPDASAMLEVKSTSGGLLIPRMTSAQRTSIDNGTGDPTEGLLVFDTDDEAFYIFENGDWTNLSMSAEIWSQNSSYVYLTNSTNNVGIGTSSPGSKLVIQADEGADLDDVLFEVLDESGNPIFEVTSVGARIYVVDPDEAGTATTGGFAVGEYNTLKSKGITPCFSTDPDETRVYSANATTGGFAVGEYNTLKEAGDTYMFMIPENYFIGHQAGDSLQTGKYSGKYNTFFGYQSGLMDTSGNDNIFIGRRSGFNNSAGDYNVFLGNNSGYTNKGIEGNPDAGSRNVFLGYNAGYYNSTGSDNVLLGYQAGYNVTTAGNNISIGSNAGFENADNSDNIFIGRQAGYGHVGTGTANEANNNIYIGLQSGMGYWEGSGAGKGNDNVFIGTYSGLINQTGSSNVFIGKESGYRNIYGDNNVFVGNKAGNKNSLGGDNVFIGTSSGEYNVDGINNVFLGYLSGQNGESGQYNTLIGAETGLNIDAATNNTFLGCYAGRYATGGNQNIFIGVNSGQYQASGGDNNIYLGNNAGSGQSSANTNTGSSNVYIGEQAGENNTSGYKNVYVGFQCGMLNEAGHANVYIGQNAGSEVTNGQFNVFIGNLAGNGAGPSSSSNTCIGYQSGTDMGSAVRNSFFGTGTGQEATGSYNTYLGHNAGFSALAGEYNVYIGESAGFVSTGSNNIFIGHGTGGVDVSTAGDNNIFIGTTVGAEVTESNILMIDKEQTTTPLIHGDMENDWLRINGELQILDQYSFPTVSGSSGDVLVSQGPGGQAVWTDQSSLDDNDWTVSGSYTYASNLTGSVGIGTTTPGVNLDVRENANTYYPMFRVYQENTSGDASIEFITQSGNTITMGIDASDGDIFKISDYSYLGVYDRFAIDLLGNVGIGTTSPAQLLDVVGDTETGGGSSGYDGSSEFVSIRAQYDNWYVGVQNEATLGESDFFIGQDFAEDGIFHIENGGNIGIGTTAPNSKLEIYGSSQNIEITNTAETEAGLIFNDSGAQTTQFAKITYNSASTNELDFYVNNATPGMTINSTGVQIGPNGTVAKNIQRGSFNAGANNGGGVLTVTISFPNTFSSTPKIIVTPRGQNYSDVFAVTTRNIGTGSFQVNIVRVDSPGGIWAQTLYLDWYAWE